TKAYGRITDYDSAVIIDGRDNSGKTKVPKGSGDGVSYDYALANEFGTVHQPARPVAYPTARRMEPEIRANIAAAVERILK
ncbi:MAG: hypothetical protein J0H32_00605, partial [Rhizobiales bacterium]|nr:hypothetical protein [Hyphomicrobiales bacterium]